MYIHLGENFIIDKSSVIGIFDLDNTTSSIHTKKLLTEFEKEGLVITISDALPKSFVLTEQDEINIIYLSPFNSNILKKRFDSMFY